MPRFDSPPACHFCEIIRFTISPFASILAHAVLIFASRPSRPCQITHPSLSTQPSMCSRASNTIHPRRTSLPRKANYASQSSLPIHTIWPSRASFAGGLIWLLIVRSLPIQVTSAILVGIPRLVSLGALVSIAIPDVVVFLSNLVSPGRHVAIVSRSSLVSLICLGLELGSTFRLGLGLGTACRPP